MATTLSASVLTVTVSEQIILAGKEQGATLTKKIAGITNIFKRIISVPNSETTLYNTHASVVAGSQFDYDNIKYARITNKE